MAVTHKVRRERKLPIQQLVILSICRFAEPIASTSLFPYLPEMVKSFGVPEADIGKWAGLCSAIFSLMQAIVGVPWGRFSDIYGRKLSILLGLTSTMITSLVWGFSTSLPMAIVVRAFAGAGNGNVGIIRTTVAEMVPFKELQPRAFSLMPLIWNIGSIFGPSIGGALANPFNVKPGQKFENPTLLQAYPYALPNIVSACFFAFGIAIGALFLEETLDTLQGRRDWGQRLGDKLIAFVRSLWLRLKWVVGRGKSDSEADYTRETEPLLKSIQDEENTNGHPATVKPPKARAPSIREVMTKQSVLNLAAYTFLATHSMAFDQLLPVFMQYPSIHGHSPHVTQPGTDGNPLRFAGGFALDHFRIGMISTFYGVAGMLIQFFVFPPVARRFGILRCFKVVACAFPIAYLLMPFTALMPTQQTQIAAGFVVMMMKCLCGIFAFPCSTILITNSASSLRVLGTLNGLSTSVAAVGRASGPAMGGAMFTAGVKAGFILAPWWLFALIAIVGAIPVFYLIEGEGFSGDDEFSDEEEDDEADDDDLLREEALEGEAEAAAESGPHLVPPQKHHLQKRKYPVEEEEEAYGAVGGLLSRTSTASLDAMTDDYDGSGATMSLACSPVGSPSRSRRIPKKVKRKTSLPIGMMGSQGVSRRYSSTLGESLSSRGSYAGH